MIPEPTTTTTTDPDPTTTDPDPTTTDPDPMTMDPTPTDPMTTNSYQTTMNPDRILNLPPFISALNYKLYSYSHHARAVVCGGSINCFHPLEAATSANGKNKAPP